MVIALDTSTQTLSLALVRSGATEPFVMERYGPPEKQSDLLPRVLLELLARHGLTLADVTGFAVGLGPGSFTGLRIGLATVKGLAYALRVPVGGASSLAALALDGPEGVTIAAVSVARRGELYVGRYRRTGASVELLGPEDAWTDAALAAWLASEPGACILGPAVHEAAAALRAAGLPEERCRAVPDIPSAWAIARLTKVPDTFEAPALFALEPHYVRASEAERNPRFPPLPGPAPVARLRDGQESS